MIVCGSFAGSRVGDLYRMTIILKQKTEQCGYANNSHMYKEDDKLDNDRNVSETDFYSLQNEIQERPE